MEATFCILEVQYSAAQSTPEAESSGCTRLESYEEFGWRGVGMTLPLICAE